MRLRDVSQVVEGTSDPAFAVDGAGTIVAWNENAALLFGIPISEAVGLACSDVVRGSDEGGLVCSADCVIKRCANSNRPVHSFDLRIEVENGERWFNLAVMVVPSSTSTDPYTIHILRRVDLQKRLEMLVRDFLVTETGISDEQAAAVISSPRSAIRDLQLTRRELDVLKLVGKGRASTAIAEQLCISTPTVNNHLQRILKKLNAHSRLEALRLAERARLL